MSERRVDPRWLLAGAAASVAAGLAVRAFLVEPACVEITHHDLRVPGLPPAWREARLVHLSDLHFGNPRSLPLFRWLVRTVNDLQPDLIAITGDFVQSRPWQGPAGSGFLARLRSRSGIVGVLGDHDYSRRRKRPMAGVAEAVAGAGIRLLRNETVELEGGLRVAGIDPTTSRVRAANLDTAIAGGTPHLLLAHSPDAIVEAAGRGVPLLLCGHTHGGQVVLPFYGPPVTHTRVHRRHASGWSSLGDTRMYTNRGLTSHWSLRFLCRPEVTVFRLVEPGS